MRAVWIAGLAAVRRRRLQSVIVGVVVTLSSGVIALCLALLSGTNAPFDRAFEQQRGAQVTALYAVGSAPGHVEGTAGPFPVATVRDTDGASWRVVGRADPGGAVDRVAVVRGRWPRAAGEVVISRDRWDPASSPVGARFATLSGEPALTVVGVAVSMSASADAWTTPAQARALPHPAGDQLLYRFADASALPREGLISTGSYQTLRYAFESRLSSTVPLLVTFGGLGLAISVLIIVITVSGAVISGLRAIGVMKSLGFTPVQVVAVHLIMIMVPSAAGALAGTAVGNVLSLPILGDYASMIGLPVGVEVEYLAALATYAGVLALVAVTALLPALRAGRLGAVRAIQLSAGSGPGRSRTAQRRLAGSRLPIPLGLGLGQLFTRPARTALTLAVLVVGASALTFVGGLYLSTDAVERLQDRSAAVQVSVDGNPVPRDISARLRALPGVRTLTAMRAADARIEGLAQSGILIGWSGDMVTAGYPLANGRWFRGEDEVVVPGPLLRLTGKRVGDTLAVQLQGRTAELRIVGELAITKTEQTVYVSGQTFLHRNGGRRPYAYEIGLAPGSDVSAYLAAVRAGGWQARAIPRPAESDVRTVVPAFALVLVLVTALGVFNVVVLNTRERRRELGVLKSVGMEPRQVVAMVVTSVAGLALFGGLLGLPAGIGLFRAFIAFASEAGRTSYPATIMDIYDARTLAAVVGVLLLTATLGALVPAGWAARAGTATVLRAE
ncbi:ABC transporter permease [Microtetraspora glauca]|uniref:FtsX-like permease family protein n=1 Tax=Microtetraspora glauca TaxID=1996 RepID=A0ABV3GU08_MICGL